jgi:hypothetical protein
MELQEINPKDLGPMHREWNKGLMVAFINRHSRWELDVRKSYAYYDADKDFVAATNDPLREGDAVVKKLNIKYWSKGV